MQDTEIKTIIKNRNNLRYEAHQSSNPDIWRRFRELKYLSKKKIREAKTKYYRKSLSSNKPKEVWKIIHSVLSPPANRIRITPDDLNSHFSSTAFRTIGKLPVPRSELNRLLKEMLPTMKILLNYNQHRFPKF